MFESHQLTEKQAITLYESGVWKDWGFRKKAEFQISQKRLCMDFSAFHEAMEKTLERPIFTHEFGLNYQGLYDEVFNGKEPPTLEDIINLIPPEKRLVINLGGVE